MAKYDITKEATEDLYKIWAYTVIPGLRAYHVRRHVLFYNIQTNGRPLIVRILHERMDYARHFSL